MQKGKYIDEEIYGIYVYRLVSSRSDRYRSLDILQFKICRDPGGYKATFLHGCFFGSFFTFHLNRFEMASLYFTGKTQHINGIFGHLQDIHSVPWSCLDDVEKISTTCMYSRNMTRNGSVDGNNFVDLYRIGRVNCLTGLKKKHTHFFRVYFFYFYGCECCSKSNMATTLEVGESEICWSNSPIKKVAVRTDGKKNHGWMVSNKLGGDDFQFD